MTITTKQLEDWSKRLFALCGEIESAHGDPAKGCYPTRLEMLTHLAQTEAARRYRESVAADTVMDAA